MELQDTVCGHNTDHRCGVIAFLVLHRFLGVPLEQADPQVARHCSTSLSTVHASVATLLDDEACGASVALASAKCAFDAALVE